jgi:uncharacterized protein YjbI with pentapeptide repeats
MANQQQLELLKAGVNAWNNSLEIAGPRVVYDDGRIFPGEPTTKADLRDADLEGADLSGVVLPQADLTSANLRNARMHGAILRRAILHGANLSNAVLNNADLYGANLSFATLSGADFTSAHLFRADLYHVKASRACFAEANLRQADLGDGYYFQANFTKADLTRASLAGSELIRSQFGKAILVGASLDRAPIEQTDFMEANLSKASLIHTSLYDCQLNGARVYGVSAWDTDLVEVSQNALLVTPSEGDEPITVDDIELAQFIYLMLANSKLRRAIDIITSKAVLILGRFTPPRKLFLDALRDALRNEGYLAIVFDFEKPTSRDLTETIGLLAHLARFVVADLTDAKSLPQELQAIVPQLPSVPVIPLLEQGKKEYAMFEHFRRYPWVLDIRHYSSAEQLKSSVRDWIVSPAEAMRQE